MRGYIYRNFIHRVLRINDTPESIALGTAVGLWIGMTPTVGIQMILMIVVGTLIRANRLAGIVMVYISNPFTLIPIYWLDYWVGARLAGIPIMARESFEQSLHTFLDRVDTEGVWPGLTYLIEVKMQIVVPMFVGGMVLGLLIAIPAYPITLRLVRTYQRRKAHKKALLRLRELRREERARDRHELGIPSSLPAAPLTPPEEEPRRASGMSGPRPEDERIREW